MRRFPLDAAEKGTHPVVASNVLVYLSSVLILGLRLLTPPNSHSPRVRADTNGKLMTLEGL
jgi:hypothetical protein